MSDDMKIPEFFEGKAFVSMSLEGHNAGTLQVWSQDMTNAGGLLMLGSAMVKIPLDQTKDPRSALVESLTAEKADILSEAHIKAEAVQHKIDDLLQIEYKEVEG